MVENSSIYHPHLDVYRNSKGEAVTLTWEQCEAVMHNLRVWYKIREEVGYWDLYNGMYKNALHMYVDEGNPYGAEITKSCLLYRLLVEGKPPLAAAPPVYMSAPQYHLVENENA